MRTRLIPLAVAGALFLACGPTLEDKLAGRWKLTEELWVDSNTIDRSEKYMAFSADGFLIRTDADGRESSRTAFVLDGSQLITTNRHGVQHVRTITEITADRLVYEYQDVARLLDGGTIRLTWERAE